MEFRYLTPNYAVSPQITPEDVPAVKAAGFVSVICNRPDAEIPEPIQAVHLRAAVEAAGMVFVDNPLIPGALTPENIATQARVQAEARGPVFAYCASGNRSSIAWALSQAGKLPTDELIARPAQWGYDLEPFRARLADLAQR
ncbi:TIGR01244 family sulfur transferase [Defluviimonas sp. WL0075]|uniref:TIGR01244 family sulfur transferase n=1 Tax=Albidovulum sediminicola TaxID=2984331 RepID=A0ABT2Z2C4_9RHOB|nr:TIGR01244 family sulfur transferase [Defluviimonas sp. WL0075]MCV2865250.1 TIGR01244 family sulfur transferase [Defluviimonas sp. WL0075]